MGGMCYIEGVCLGQSRSKSTSASSLATPRNQGRMQPHCPHPGSNMPTFIVVPLQREPWRWPFFRQALARMPASACRAARRWYPRPCPDYVHADVREMLLTGRALTDAGRALAVWTALQMDIAARHPDEEERRKATASSPC